MDLERKWQLRFSYLALKHTEPHRVSHWTRRGFIVRRKKVRRLVGRLHRPGEQVLDLGSGPGHYADCFDRAVLLDYSRHVLESMADPFPHAPVCANFHALPFRDRCFDAVLSVGLLQCLTLRPDDLPGLSRLLKPGAWFLFETLNSECTALNGELPESDILRLKKFSRDPSDDPCCCLADEFVLYHAGKLSRWFERAGFKVQGIQYVYILDNGALLEEPFHRVEALNSAGRRYAKSFLIYGTKR